MIKMNEVKRVFSAIGVEIIPTKVDKGFYRLEGDTDLIITLVKANKGNYLFKQNFLREIYSLFEVLAK